jgi:hypothetical protein
MYVHASSAKRARWILGVSGESFIYKFYKKQNRSNITLKLARIMFQDIQYYTKN